LTNDNRGRDGDIYSQTLAKALLCTNPFNPESDVDLKVDIEDKDPLT